MFFDKELSEIESQSEALGIAIRTVSLPESFPDMFKVLSGDSFPAILDDESLVIECNVYCPSFRSEFEGIIYDILDDDVPTISVGLLEYILLEVSGADDTFLLVDLLDIMDDMPSYLADVRRLFGEVFYRFDLADGD